MAHESGKHAPLKKSKNGDPSPGWPFSDPLTLLTKNLLVIVCRGAALRRPSFSGSNTLSRSQPPELSAWSKMNVFPPANITPR